MTRNIKKISLQVMLLAAFLAGSAAFIAYAKTKTTSYLSQLQAYASQLASLQDQVSTPEGIAKLQTLMETLSPIVQKANYLTYYITPAVLFILWVTLIGTSFYLSRKTAKKYLNYLLGFAAISAVPFIVCIYLLYSIIQSGGMSFLGQYGWGMALMYGTILLLVSYLTFVAYALSMHDSLRKALQQTFKVSLKKSYILLPMIFLLVALSLTLVLLTISTYFSIFFSNSPLVYNMIPLLLALTLTIMLKNYLIRKTIKMSNFP